MERSVRELMLLARRLPGRLDAEEVSALTGFLPHEITVLMRAGLLKSALLGAPAQNGHKFFSRNAILKLCDDDTWLNKATKAVQRAWQKKPYKSAEEKIAV